MKTRQLRNPADSAVPLTKGEYALLLAFIEAAERPLSREYLLQATRVHEDIFDRSIDVQIPVCVENWKSTPAFPRLSKPNAVLVTCLLCQRSEVERLDATEYYACSEISKF